MTLTKEQIETLNHVRELLECQVSEIKQNNPDLNAKNRMFYRLTNAEIEPKLAELNKQIQDNLEAGI